MSACSKCGGPAHPGLDDLGELEFAPRCVWCVGEPTEAGLPYRGAIQDGEACVYAPLGVPLLLDPAVAPRNHSSADYAWGYMGTGPAVLAFALLLNSARMLGLSDAAAERHYWRFMRDIVSQWPTGAPWAISAGDVARWLMRRERQTGHSPPA